MILPPPRSTLFPYTTLFRSRQFDAGGVIPLRSAAGICRSSGDECHGHRHVPCLHRDRGAYDRLGDARRRCDDRSEEHTSELQSLRHLVCRLLLEKKKKINIIGSRERGRNRRRTKANKTRKAYREGNKRKISTTRNKLNTGEDRRLNAKAETKCET